MIWMKHMTPEAVSRDLLFLTQGIINLFNTSNMQDVVLHDEVEAPGQNLVRGR